MSININSLGKHAQEQIKQQLKKQEQKENIKKLKNNHSSGIKPMFESKLEEEYYNNYIWPLILTKDIINVEIHKTFLLLEKSKYSGINLPKAEYTPDFIITYKNDAVEIVEVKHKKIRQLQQSYVYRRRLFIDLYCRPNNWKFTEYIKE